MKQVETNFLIYDLAKKGNSKARYSLFKFLFGIICLAGLSIIVYLLNVDLRADLDNVMSQPIFSIFNLQFYVFLINVFLGSYILYQQSIPGRTDFTSYKILTFVFYALWIAMYAVLFNYAYVDFANGARNFIEIHCVDRLLLALVIPLFVILYSLKRGYILNKVSTTMSAVLTAFAFAGFINLMVCPELSVLCILCSHHLVIFVLILILLGAFKLFDYKKKRGKAKS